MATWIFDCDGVLWKGDEVLPRAAEAIQLARDAGVEVGFVSNFSGRSPAGFVEKLERAGIPALRADVVTSLHATLGLIVGGSRVMVCGLPAIAEFLMEHDIDVREEPPVDAVVVGLDPAANYEKLSRATTALLAGARLVATNDDPLYPSPGGPRPGAGSIVAFLERATGQIAEVAGKPNAAMIAAMAERFPQVDVVVGDRPASDGALAKALGARFGYVTSDVAHVEAGTDVVASVVGEDVGEVVDGLLRPQWTAPGEPRVQ